MHIYVYIPTCTRITQEFEDMSSINEKKEDKERKKNNKIQFKNFLTGIIYFLFSFVFDKKSLHRLF